MKKYKVTLTQEERDQLEAVSHTGKQRTQNVLNALILLACDEGPTQKSRSINEKIATVLNISMKTIDRVKKRFVEEGFDAIMSRKPTSRIYPRKVDGDLEAHLIALCCSKAPEGHVRWTLRMLANKVVELNYVDMISHETVRRALKKTSLSLGSRGDG